MSKTKTIKIAAIKTSDVKPISVDATKVIDPSKINFNLSFEDEIKNKDYDELDYMLNFEETDPKKRQMIKDRMKQLKK
ncbi:MAG: hypothetical protein LBL60_03410 [Mycoplasmataceae bacterium]|jgi:hypothetical protein|nr:hypothetical protein [Mycoplasmataceae bacterium]